MSFPRAAFGVTPKGAMPADLQSRIGGIPGWTVGSVTFRMLGTAHCKWTSHSEAGHTRGP